MEEPELPTSPSLFATAAQFDEGELSEARGEVHKKLRISQIAKLSSTLFSDDDRRDLMLMVIGWKQANFFHTSFCETEAEVQRHVAERVVLLEALGFMCAEPILTSSTQSVIAEVAYQGEVCFGNTLEAAQQVREARVDLSAEQDRTGNLGSPQHDRVIGELVGYPSTAVEAYIEANATGNYTLQIPTDELPVGTLDSDYVWLVAYSVPVLSRAHWREELKIYERQYGDLLHYAPEFAPEFAQAYVQNAREHTAYLRSGVAGEAYA
jgi:hypothetical protein